MIGHPEAWEPMVGEPIVGWRTWSARLTDDGWELRSIYHDKTWAPGRPLEAECLSHDRHLLPAHQSPAPPGFMVKRAPAWPTLMHQTYAHECGIFAARNVQQATTYRLTVPGDGCVVGTVSLWGKVAVHQKGYRAQYGYPARIVLCRAPDEIEDWELAAELADRYGIDSEMVCP